MDVKNCKGCGKIFNYLTGPQLCPSCVKSLDLKFEKVKEYVYDNPGVGMQEVADAMEVSIPQIKQWIRDERLAFTDNSMIGLECEGCGITIKTGRYCNSCKDRLAKGLGDLYKKTGQQTAKQKQNPNVNPKMRFLDQS